MSEHLLLIIIVIADILGIGLALFLHYQDSSQQEDYRNEEISLLSEIADALNVKSETNGSPY